MEFSIEQRLPTPPLPAGEVVVNAPPNVPPDAPGNPLSKLLPAVMVVATVGMMVFYTTSGGSAVRNPMFVFFPMMTLASLLGTVITGARGGTSSAEINRDRRDYLRHLAAVDNELVEASAAQRTSLSWRHPHPACLWTIVGGRRMWERRSDDEDFGHLRIGVATQPLSASLIAPDLGPAEDRDPVTSDGCQRLVRLRSSVPDLPVALDIRSLSRITVSGDTPTARSLVRAALCQLAVLHSPQDVRIAAAVDPLTAPEWDWLKWLPHHQHPRAVDECGSARMTYPSISSAEMALADCGATHALLLVDGDLTAYAEGAPLSRTGVTVLEVGSRCANGADAALVIGGDQLTIRRDATEDVMALPDVMSAGQALACARRLAAHEPAATPPDGTARVSKSAAWPELMGIADVGGIDPAVLWRTTRAAERELCVPIGVAEHGGAIDLDIKEAASHGMGPHGLCIGATGSGKSEFLRTLTLGMIARHPPESLNLVLVDFKGGATFLGFERAHHVAAVITNLANEAHLVARMKDALAGEMNRRQEQLRAAGNLPNIGHYRRVRGSGTGLAPMPALLIVVDEFSELLSQHPDFIDLFIAIGRLGRSLGMHLLLASQRVDEGRLRGLESHLSYRVCLKTFSAAESRAVLGVPDAYHLPSTPGAGYLKTGSGDPIRFQAAFVSGPYRSAVVCPTTDDAVPGPRAFSATPVGSVAFAGEPPAGDVSADAHTVLDTVLDRLAGSGSPAHRVWLPPLADSPALDTLLQRAAPGAGLTVPIGVVDRPFEQRRDALVAQLAGAAGNVAIVGGPRSGKSTALQTLILALAEIHDPRDVQFYCLDFGGGVLSSLRRLPHVGSVADRRHVDVIRRTLGQLESLLRAREARRGSIGACAQEDRYGHVFLVVDGWSAIRHEFDAMEAQITALAAQGLSYGIHVVISASRWAEIRPAMKDQIGTRIELRLGDPAESEMDRKRARQLVQSPPGRGITRDGHEFVIAVPSFDAAVVDRLRTRHAGRDAPPIEVLPTRLGYGALITQATRPRYGTDILLGISETELEPTTVDFGRESHLLILGQGECGKTATLRTLCCEIARTNTAALAQLFIIDYRRTLLGVVESDHLAGYTPSAAALAPQLADLVQRLQERMPGADVTQQQLRSRSWWSGPEIYVVIDDYDLVATPNGVNPVTPLLDLLPHAKDIGLHVIVARRSGGAARGMFDPVLARIRDLGCMGLMMSASSDEGVLLGAVRPTELPPGRGTLITRAHPDRLVQVAWIDPP